MVRCWLDIDIGDEQAHAIEAAAFERTQRCFEEIKAQYGWSGTMTDLDEEGQEMLLTAYSSDPKWSSQGPGRASAPPSLHAGRIVVELNAEACPKAAENFPRGKGKGSGKPLHYRGTRFHRIVQGFMAQGGDVVKGDGSAGDSIYGKPFNDEKAALKLKHDAAGVVSMANSGNTSQFFITLAPAPACDGKHVVLGKVMEGADVLSQIDRLAASESGSPKTSVVIRDCGAD
ncbi:hypothetical protein QBZ16_003957 [Prototheca wickerhamii]|uniref:Peptidyl-prolyl cis-trans isomerase n=1 Tax=Prototheca wickerhamii TaxID=3111 RepID=A0AAD9MH68_PROWI|nr:hypothetical protein QBZ16_003957 [Prototheca wickerhamii]